MSVKEQIGNFCWWSLMTKDVAKANDFYQQVFGWGLSEIDIPDQGKSTIYTTAQGGFANPVQLETDFPGPSHWVTYIIVEDVDQACDRVQTLGGQVCVPAFDIPTIGRTAVVEDPAGTPFHLFTPTQDDDNLNMIGNAAGQVCWMELMVDDPTPLLAFYRELFGWQFSEPMAVNGGEYISFKVGGNQVGGLMKRPTEAPQMPPVWMNYFAVDAIDSWSERIKAAGGQVIMPKTEIPETGFFSMIADPTGAQAYLLEMSPKDEP